MGVGEKTGATPQKPVGVGPSRRASVTPAGRVAPVHSVPPGRVRAAPPPPQTSADASARCRLRALTRSARQWVCVTPAGDAWRVSGGCRAAEATVNAPSIGRSGLLLAGMTSARMDALRALPLVVSTDAVVQWVRVDRERRLFWS